MTMSRARNRIGLDRLIVPDQSPEMGLGEIRIFRDRTARRGFFQEVGSATSRWRMRNALWSAFGKPIPVRHTNGSYEYEE